jgi:broad specificity phosphatase PhoE
MPPTAPPDPTCRRIFLVRHGETLYGGAREGALPGQDLTERGYRQIEALGEMLSGVSLDAIYASPLGRAQASARTLAAKTGAPVTTVESLCEIIPGDLAQLDMAQIFAAVRGFFANGDTDWDTPYLGGETYRTLRDRVWPLFEDLLRRSDWRRIAVVAHGGVNNAVIGHVIGALGPRLANVEQDFGCVNIIDVVADRPILRLLNFTAYDPLKTSMETSSLEILKGVLEAGLAITLEDTEDRAK